MSATKYRAFVCTKQRGDLNNPENCCFNCGGVEIYRAFCDRIDYPGRLCQRQQLANRVEIRHSGCLDRCESGIVVGVYRASWHFA